MSSIDPSPLTAHFGAEIHGIEISSDLEPRAMRALADAFVEHKLLLLRGQQMSLEIYARFAREWGSPRNDAFTDFNVPGFPDLSRVGNTGGMLETEENRNSSCFWHTDCAAEPVADATTMLYCRHAPEDGGETIVGDMQIAYDTLDGPTRETVDALSAYHSYPGTRPNLDGREDFEYPMQAYTTETLHGLPQGMRHPLVRRHTVTGRRGLYAPAGSIVAIEGMEHGRARELLRRIKLHAVDERFCYRHRYQPGDLLMWDNSATMHRAAPIGAARGVRNRRLLYRIVPTGVPKALGTARHSPA